MPIPTYTPRYPPDGSSLGQTKATIRDNLDGTFETINVDHVNNNGQPGSNPAGYHTLIHQVTQTNVSGPIANVNQVFSGVPGTLIVNGVTIPAIPPDGFTELFNLSSGSKLSQLCGGVSATPNGYNWAGGILFQWGQVAFPTQSGTVNFATANVAFPNQCFTVMLQLQRNGSTTVQGIYLNGVPTTSSFSWTGSSSGSTALWWLAIGA
jgi:hypothetical protein